jgi:hypothetical protein
MADSEHTTMAVLGALDADGQGLTVTGLNDEERAALCAKLQKAIEFVKALPVAEVLDDDSFPSPEDEAAYDREEAERLKKVAKKEEDVLIDLLKKEQDAACILIKVDGVIEKVLEPFSSRKQGYLDLAKCRKHLDCKYIEMVPCTVAVPSGKYEILLDEEGQMNGSQYNHVASSILGTQTVGGLFGNVLLFKAGALE